MARIASFIRMPVVTCFAFSFQCFFYFLFAAHISSFCKLTAGDLWIFLCELKQMSHANGPPEKRSAKQTIEEKKKLKKRKKNSNSIRVSHMPPFPDPFRSFLCFCVCAVCSGQTIEFKMTSFIRCLSPLQNLTAIERRHSHTCNLVDGTRFQVHAKSDLNNVNESSRKVANPIFCYSTLAISFITDTFVFTFTFNPVQLIVFDRLFLYIPKPIPITQCYANANCDRKIHIFFSLSLVLFI